MTKPLTREDVEYQEWLKDMLPIAGGAPDAFDGGAFDSGAFDAGGAAAVPVPAMMYSYGRRRSD